MERVNKLTLMSDLLEHMGDCCDHWQSTQGQTQRYWEESMRNDMAEFRRLCASVRDELPTVSRSAGNATAAC